MKYISFILRHLTIDNIRIGVSLVNQRGIGALCAMLRRNVKRDAAWQEYREAGSIYLPEASDLSIKPRFSIITPTFNTRIEHLDKLVGSVLAQHYPDWELCIADGHSVIETVERLRYWQSRDTRIKVKFLGENRGIAGNSIEAYNESTGDYIVLLDHDDYLSADALFWLAISINHNHDVDFIYSDRAVIADKTMKLLAHHFLPGFSIDMLRACNYASHLNAFSRWIIDKVGFERSGFDGSQDYDLELRVVEHARKIIHIPRVLYYCRACIGSVARDPESKMYAYDAGRKVIEEHLERIKCPGVVEFIKETYSYRIHYQINSHPLVSIIIANKDHLRELQKCITSIVNKSSYGNYEIIVVENNSSTEDIFEYYKRLEQSGTIRVIAWGGRDFNFSAINNHGVSFAKGEHVILLNNDIEVISNCWVEEMLMFSQREDVGAVGAKLYYKNNRIQHAGLVIGLAGSIASHYHHGADRAFSGYMHRLMMPQNYSAVTGACLMVKKQLYNEVGGLDEDYFKIGLNDVDFCLKLRELNKINVFTPYAELYHHESVSRGPDTAPDQLARFQAECAHFRVKWRDYFENGDPYDNDAIRW